MIVVQMKASHYMKYLTVTFFMQNGFRFSYSMPRTNISPDAHPFLTDGAPIDATLPQLSQSSPEDVVLRIPLFGVGNDDGLGGVSGDSEDLAIAGKIGYFEVESHARLLGAFKVAGTSEFEVLLGYFKAISFGVTATRSLP